MEPIAPKAIRYIKLGEGGRWVRPSLGRGEMHFGYRMIAHEPCVAGDWDAVLCLLAETTAGRLGKARDKLREIRDFYTLGPDCLWITFADGHLWWAFATPEVTWLGPGEGSQGVRIRRVIDGWRKTDIVGRPLKTSELSSKLTQVTSYQQSICSVGASDYLIRRINSVEEPVLARAREARSAMIDVARAMITDLHWADFETLVDLIFARTGWQRVSRVGGNQQDFDLILEEQATGETAFVQVKSRASTSAFEDYLERFDASQAYDRMFFVCHSPSSKIVTSDRSDVHIWAGQRLAETAVRAGLFDWLVERSR